jgi:hypothetical protein
MRDAIRLDSQSRWAVSQRLFGVPSRQGIHAGAEQRDGDQHGQIVVLYGNWGGHGWAAVAAGVPDDKTGVYPASERVVDSFAKW